MVQRKKNVTLSRCRPIGLLCVCKCLLLRVSGARGWWTVAGRERLLFYSVQAYSAQDSLKQTTYLFRSDKSNLRPTRGHMSPVKYGRHQCQGQCTLQSRWMSLTMCSLRHPVGWPVEYSPFLVYHQYLLITETTFLKWSLITYCWRKIKTKQIKTTQESTQSLISKMQTN